MVECVEEGTDEDEEDEDEKALDGGISWCGWPCRIMPAIFSMPAGRLLSYPTPQPKYTTH